MSDGWGIKPIEEVAFIQEGPGIRKYEYEEGGFPMINVRCVQNGYIDMSSARAARRELADGKWKHFQIEAGDILFTISGTIGRCAIVREEDLPLLMNTSVVRFRPTTETLDRDYLYYFLQSDGFQKPLDEMASGAAIRNVGPTHIKRLNIPLPPLEEQQRIVAVLDEAFEGLARARAHAEANLQNARELFSLSFEHELLAHCDTSPGTTIGEICSGFEYGTSAKSQPSGKVPVLRMGNLQAGEVDWSELVFTDNKEDIEKLTLSDGDVLFNRTNSLEHVGKSAIYRGNRPAIFAGYLIRLHFDRSTILPDFLNMYLNSAGARAYGRSISGKSVNQANISASKLKTYPIRLPPISVQTAIVEKANNLRQPLANLEAEYQTKLQDLGDLRQSLLQKAFAGELT